jgi:hypothetical protein
LPTETVTAPEPAPEPIAAAPAPPPAPAPEVVTEQQARILLSRFSQAYRNGDINALMRLFSVGARNNRGGRDAIVFDYQSLFSSTRSRDLRLMPSGWITREGGATVLASYEAKVQVDRRSGTTVSRGEIRFDLVEVDGELRISLVRHDPDR